MTNKNSDHSTDLRKSARVVEQARQLSKAVESVDGEKAFPCDFTASGNGKVGGTEKES